MTRRLMFLPFVALLSVAAVFGACGDDDDNKKTSTPTVARTATSTAIPNADGAAAEAFMQELATTFNSGDYATFVSRFSDKGIREFYQQPDGDPAQLRQEVPVEVEAGGTITIITIHEIKDVKTIGGTTTLTLDSDDGSSLVRETFELKKKGTTFEIDGYSRGIPDLPAGTTALTVEATEYQYILTPPTVTNGKIAFKFSNIGSQDHEMGLAKLDATTPVQDIVDAALALPPHSSDMPAGVESFSGHAFAAPGGADAFVPLQAMAPGRYLMICFIPDATDEKPHAEHGMYKEFTIP